MKDITLEEIREHVIENGFGLETCHVGFKADYMSAGIAYALEQVRTENTGQVGRTHPFFLEVYGACERFCNNDFGDMYECDEDIVKGSEWGNYETCIGDVRIHREDGQILLFFPFER